MNFQEFSTFEDYLVSTVSYIENIFLQNKNFFLMAFPGGKTPLPIFSKLVQSPIFAQKKFSLELYTTDERYVPYSNTHSNFKMIYENFVQPLEVRYEKNDSQSHVCCFASFRTDIDIESSVKKYEKMIKHVQELGGFDLCILGIGPDGHIASLFPNAAALQEKNVLALHTCTEQFDIHDRLTLTFPAIMKSKKILLLATGKEKKNVINDLLSSEKTFLELPAKKLLEHPDLTLYYSQE